MVTVKQPQVEQEARCNACFIVATNVMDTSILSDQELVTTYKEQGSVERGFRFLKDPLFLASSVFVKKPERIVALGLIMVLCLTSLSAGRTSAAHALSRNRADHSRSAQPTNGPSHHAMGLSVF
jgi:transposase